MERVRDKVSQAIIETLLAMTIFRQDFTAHFLSQFVLLAFVKIFHWLAQDRVDFIETSPDVSWPQHARLLSFLLLLVAFDNVLLRRSLAKTVAHGVSVHLLFAFEYAVQIITALATIGKYVLSGIDLAMNGHWEGKGVAIFYLSLTRDLLHLITYTVFFAAVFSTYGIPIHLVRDLYWTFRNFHVRVRDFLRYRRVAANMERRFPNASNEDLDRADHTCIICREDMPQGCHAKKLDCGHVFHMKCLRSWLERQQNCPVCRAPVAADRPPPAQQQRRADRHENQQIQRQIERSARNDNQASNSRNNERRSQESVRVGDVRNQNAGTSDNAPEYSEHRAGNTGFRSINGMQNTTTNAASRSSELRQSGLSNLYNVPSSTSLTPEQRSQLYSQSPSEMFGSAGLASMPDLQGGNFPLGSWPMVAVPVLIPPPLPSLSQSIQRNQVEGNIDTSDSPMGSEDRGPKTNNLSSEDHAIASAIAAAAASAAVSAAMLQYPQILSYQSSGNIKSSRNTNERGNAAASDHGGSDVWKPNVVPSSDQMEEPIVDTPSSSKNRVPWSDTGTSSGNTDHGNRSNVKTSGNDENNKQDAERIGIEEDDADEIRRRRLRRFVS